MRRLVLTLACCVTLTHLRAEQNPIHHLSDLLQLDDALVAQSLPCDITATVTLYDPIRYQFYVQEADAGGLCAERTHQPLETLHWRPGPHRRPLPTGAPHAPVIFPDRITRLAHTGMPAPLKPPSWSAVRNTDAFDNRFAEVEGRLLSIRPLYLDGSDPTSGAYQLRIESHGETVEAFVNSGAGHQPAWHVQSDVIVRGVITPSRMLHKQRHDAWLAGRIVQRYPGVRAGTTWIGKRRP